LDKGISEHNAADIKPTPVNKGKEYENIYLQREMLPE
jgi:hypothetical protein